VFISVVSGLFLKIVKSKKADPRWRIQDDGTNDVI